jgi:hypothetical protein
LALVLAAKVAFASPRFAIALVLRLVQSFIHSYTCEFGLIRRTSKRGDLVCANFSGVWLEVNRLSYGKSSFYQRFSLKNLVCAKRRTGTGGY